MAKRKYTPEQIIGILRQAEVAVSNGRSTRKPAGRRVSLSKPSIVGARNTAG